MDPGTEAHFIQSQAHEQPVRRVEGKGLVSKSGRIYDPSISSKEQATQEWNTSRNSCVTAWVRWSECGHTGARTDDS